MALLAPIMVVTGTGPGVGKTVTTAALAAGFDQHDLRVVVVKLAQTGRREGEPGDLEEVVRLAGDVETHELFRLEDPLPLVTGARRRGVVLPLVDEHADRLISFAGREDVDLVLVESTGGVLDRLDGPGGTLADLGITLRHRHARVGVVVVTRPGLGALNACALTTEALAARDLECLGVVLGSWPKDPDLVALTNLSDLPSVTDAPLIGRIPEEAGSWERERFRAESPAWVTL
ncbi:MAG TPA: ATP-dependent dethiobiotin synthetase BioD [Segeticoccus sp.]|jgi:dethiobiotin synthetase|nr:ATP-dependent dethiobiotin synthetase BioD [Segeticoccus sp.]